MTLAGDVADLVALLTAAGLQARTVASEDPAVAPCVILEAPTLDNGRRTGAGSVLEARCDLVAVSERVDAVPFVDVVLEALDAAGVLVDAAVPTGHYAGDTINPLPAYRVTVRWPFTITSTGGTP